jgi:thiopeptide-type bacteriocin biosynthesis protein
MAAVSRITIEDRTTSLTVSDNIRIHARLDNECTLEIAKKLDNKLLNNKLSGFIVRTNNTMHIYENELRRVTWEGDSGEAHYHLSAMERTREINFVLQFIKDGTYVENLVTAVMREFKCPSYQAEDFVRKLITCKLLVTDLKLTLTRGDCFSSLINQAARIPLLAEDTHRMRGIYKTLSKINNGRTYLRSEEIDSLRAGLSQLIETKGMVNFVHVDAYRDNENARISKFATRSLLDNISIIFPYLWKPYEPLVSFATKFHERYGDAEVPLLEALDPDIGIPFGPKRFINQPLLKGIIPKEKSDPTVSWEDIHNFLFEKFMEAAKLGANEIVLKEDELCQFRDEIDEPAEHIDTTLSVHATMLASKEASGSPLWLLRGIHDSSSICLMGRFTCGEPNLLKDVRQLAEDEQRRDTRLLAEIVHSPSGKVANILARGVIRDTEIVYGDCNPSENVNVITCDDLVVGIKNQKLYLRSRKLNRIIAPRLSAAHNEQGHHLPAYQFLVAMQYLDGRPQSFFNSEVFHRMEFRPRIRVGSLILSLARWLINESEIRDLCAPSTVVQQVLSVKHLCLKRALPRFVCMAEGDNILEIDFHSPISILNFIHEIKSRKAIRLMESMRELDIHCTTFEGSLLRNEIVIPIRAVFSNDTKWSGDEKKPVKSSGLEISRQRQLNNLSLENWICFEIFSGELTLEKVLLDQIYPIISRDLLSAKLKQWFFVRYFTLDGGTHLRLRLLPSVTSAPMRIDILDELMTSFRHITNDGRIHHINIVGYEPEEYRYGGRLGLELCEKIFHAQSELVISLLNEMIFDNNKEQMRWLSAVLLVWNDLFDFFGSAIKVNEFSQYIVESYRKEMRIPAVANKNISYNYRLHLPLIEGMLGKRGKEHIIVRNVKSNPFNERRAYYIYKLRRILDPEIVVQVASSIIHMNCNRVFPFYSRANEMMVYEYVRRFSRSVVERIDG